MTLLVRGKMIAAGLAVSAAGLMALPTTAAAHHTSWHSARQAKMSAHHRAIWQQGYRAGYHRAWHEARGDVHGDDLDVPVVTGRSAAVDPVHGPLGYEGPFAGDGLLGTGVLNGRGVLGTGVLGGTGLLGIGIAGF